MAHARRGMAFETWRGCGTRHRDLANINRRTSWLPTCTHSQWKRLRSGRPRYCPAECTLSNERHRPVPSYRSGRSAGRRFRYPKHAPFRRRTAALPLVANNSRTVSFKKKSKYFASVTLWEFISKFSTEPHADTGKIVFRDHIAIMANVRCGLEAAARPCFTPETCHGSR